MYQILYKSELIHAVTKPVKCMDKYLTAYALFSGNYALISLACHAAPIHIDRGNE